MSPALSALVSVVAILLAAAALVLATVANRRWVAGPPARWAQAPDPNRGAPVDGPAPTPDGAPDGATSDGATFAVADLTALRHVAVVRYDAFSDVGGRLSHSVAILDDTCSGLVLTTLAGKADVRTYVRTISGGVGDGTLTAEEQQAIEAAVGSGQ